MVIERIQFYSDGYRQRLYIPVHGTTGLTLSDKDFGDSPSP